MARASGLTVSALRFYDGAGLLVPDWVDPDTGYRWYADRQLRPAQLLARLRRVGMPLAEIALVLGGRADPAAVRPLLDGHLRRLEDGLAAARRELSHVDDLLGDEENPMTHTHLTLRSAELAAALDAVRFAAGADPELPMLAGVLFDATGAGLRLVATDRYRLAVAEAPARRRTVAGTPARRGTVAEAPAESGAGDEVAVLVPTALVDEIRALLTGDEEATISLDHTAITVSVAGRQVRGERLDLNFPDYRRLTSTVAEHRFDVDVASFRQHLTTAKPQRTAGTAGPDVAVLAVGPDGALGFDGPETALRVGVNREFLLEALAAGGQDQLVLELDGPITPLAIRLPGDDRTYSILMPTKLTD
jgi:DNA-binding transcriptional MerR regulator